jgi:hypothetical protein
MGYSLNNACQIPFGRVITDSHDGDISSDELWVTQTSYIDRSVDANMPSTRQLSGARCISDAVMLGVSGMGHRYRPLSLHAGDDMTKKRAAVTGIALAIIILVSIFAVVPMAMSSTLTWSISVGDKTTYHVAVEGWELDVAYVVVQPSRYAVMDGVNVSSEIVLLPELGFFLTGGEFAKRVVQIDKVNVTFQNGTIIPDDIASRLKSMLSNCILPTSSWPLIDVFFPDTYTTEPGAGTYWSHGGTSSFHFGYYSFGFDSITQMSSSVSYETGLPSVVSYRYRHGVDAEFNITLVQI